MQNYRFLYRIQKRIKLVKELVWELKLLAHELILCPPARQSAACDMSNGALQHIVQCFIFCGGVFFVGISPNLYSVSSILHLILTLSLGGLFNVY